MIWFVVNSLVVVLLYHAKTAQAVCIIASNHTWVRHEWEGPGGRVTCALYFSQEDSCINGSILFLKLTPENGAKMPARCVGMALSRCDAIVDAELGCGKGNMMQFSWRKINSETICEVDSVPLTQTLKINHSQLLESSSFRKALVPTHVLRSIKVPFACPESPHTRALEGVSYRTNVTICGESHSVSDTVVISSLNCSTLPSQLGQLTSLTRLYLPWSSLEGTIPTQLGGLKELESLNLTGNTLSGVVPTEFGGLGNLVELELSQNWLEARIPTELGELSVLRTMKIEENRLTGSIPPHIGKIQKLQHLFLNQNSLTGTIPSYLGNLKSLFSLSLGENPFYGAIPTQLGALEKLQILYLWKNELNGTIPSSLGHLSSLRNLVLTQSRLGGPIPTQLGKLEALKLLSLWGNKLSKPIPTSLGSLSRLTLLSFAQNLLTGPLPTQLGKLKNLDFFNLMENRMSDKIPATLGSLESLTALSLAKNMLEGPIPTSIGKLDRLVSLYLWQNILTGPIPLSFGRLSSLVDLDLSENSLDGPIPTQVGMLSLLNVLSLWVNKLTGTIPTSLGSLSLLTDLTLSDNAFTGTLPTQLGNLVHLTRLALWTNSITGIIPTSLGLLSSLNDLALSNNSFIGTLPVQLGNLLGLKRLLMWGNHITGTIPTSLGRLKLITHLSLGPNPMEGPIPSEIGTLAELKYLHLLRTQLSGTIPTSFGRLFALESLNLAQCALIGPIPSQLGSLSSLIGVSIAKNLLTGTIPTELGKLVGLKRMQVWGNNFIGEIPTELANLMFLEEVDFSNNQLTGSISPGFGAATNLIHLGFGTNRMGGTIPKQLGRLTELTSLHLINNKFSGSLPSELSNLPVLALLIVDGNAMNGSIPKEFGNLTALSALSFVRNRLSGQIPTQLGNLKALVKLGLEDNLLSGVIPLELAGLTKLTELTLAGNLLDGSIPLGFGNMNEMKTLSLDIRHFKNYEQLNEFANLSQVHFGVVDCDCRFVSWYSDFLAAAPGLGNVFKAAVCSGVNAYEGLYPHILQVEETAPCSHVVDIHNPSLTAREAEIAWSYPYFEREIEHNLVSVDFGDFAYDAKTRSFANMDRPLSNADAASLFDQCQGLYFYSRIPPIAITFGYEIVWTEPESRFRHRRCMFAKQALHSHSRTFTFTLSGLHPATSYEVMLRPFFLKFKEHAAMSYIFGPQSQAFSITTMDDIPDSPPRKLEVKLVRSREIELFWSPPDGAERNGQVQNYLIQVTHLQTGSQYDWQSGVPQKRITLSDKFIVGQIAQSTFEIRVKAKTRVPAYSDWSESLRVSTCPEFMLRKESNNVEDCFATTGYYRQKSNHARSCTDLERELPRGALLPNLCLADGTRIETIALSPGFWRPNLSSEDIRRCPDVRFCSAPSTRGFNSSLSPNQYCAPNHKGTYCMDCADQYVLGPHGCEFCTTRETESHLAFVVLLSLFVVVFLGLHLRILARSGFLRKLGACGSRRMPLHPTDTSRTPRRESGMCSKGLKKARAAAESCKGDTVGTKVRILLGYFQVLSSFQRTFQQHHRGVRGDFSGFVTFVSNMDFTWVLGNIALLCSYNYSHYDILLLVTLAPILLILSLYLASAGLVHFADSTRSLQQRVSREFVYEVLLLLFLIYPFISQTVLSTFWCDDFADADRSINLTSRALRTDYSLSCERDVDPNRILYEFYAGFMVVLYPIGVVFLYIAVLLHYRRRTDTRDDQHVEKMTVLFLIKPYKEERFWFEAYELVRKLIQTCLVGFLQSSSLETEIPGFSALLSLNLIVFFTVLLMTIRPYKCQSDFCFAVVSLLMLLPATQFSLVDQFGRFQEVATAGLDGLIIAELVVFLTFTTATTYVFPPVQPGGGCPRSHGKAAGVADDGTNNSSSKVADESSEDISKDVWQIPTTESEVSKVSPVKERTETKVDAH